MKINVQLHDGSKAVLTSEKHPKVVVTLTASGPDTHVNVERATDSQAVYLPVHLHDLTLVQLKRMYENAVI